MARRILGPLPERAQVEAEEFAHAALGVFNFAVHLASGQIDELRRQISDERLEAEALFKFRTRVALCRAHRIMRRLAKAGRRAKAGEWCG